MLVNHHCNPKEAQATSEPMRFFKMVAKPAGQNNRSITVINRDEAPTEYILPTNDKDEAEDSDSEDVLPLNVKIKEEPLSDDESVVGKEPTKPRGETSDYNPYDFLSVSIKEEPKDEGGNPNGRSNVTCGVGANERGCETGPKLNSLAGDGSRRGNDRDAVHEAKGRSTTTTSRLRSIRRDRTKANAKTNGSEGSSDESSNVTNDDGRFTLEGKVKVELLEGESPMLPVNVASETERRGDNQAPVTVLEKVRTYSKRAPAVVAAAPQKIATPSKGVLSQDQDEEVPDDVLRASDPLRFKILCPECGMVFLSEHGLNRHLGIKHPNIMHYCKFCRTMISGEAHVKKHELTPPKLSVTKRKPHHQTKFNSAADKRLKTLVSSNQSTTTIDHRSTTVENSRKTYGQRNKFEAGSNNNTVDAKT